MYISINEAAQILNLSIKATRRYVASGRLYATFKGGVYMIKEKEHTIFTL